MSSPTDPIDQEAAERRARHLAYALQIQESASRMLHSATTRAVHQMDQPAPQAEPDRLPQARPRERDYALAAIRFAKMLDTGIALENDILAGKFGYCAAPAPRAPAPPDPRRDLIREPLIKAVQAENAPGQAARIRDIDTQIDAKLAADPQRLTDPFDILAAIVELLAIDVDPADLSPEILGQTRAQPLPETGCAQSPPERYVS